MAITEDLAKIAIQEKKLTVPILNHEMAWQLGLTIRELAVLRGYALVIDVRRFGHPLFYSALPGTTPDNADWVRRKANTVARFHRSSYAIGLELQLKKSTLTERYGVAASEYASHGGSFPLTVPEAGVIGCVTVSGLPQRDDHELVVEALCLHTDREYQSLKLPSLTV